MRLDARNPGLLREIRDLLDSRDARFAILARHQADGFRPLVKVINFGARTTRNRGGHLHAVFLQRHAQFLDRGIVEYANR